MSYKRGEVAQVYLRDLLNEAGKPYDPEEITLTLRRPDGSTVTYAYPPEEDGVIQREGVGSYFARLLLGEPGSWEYRWAVEGQSKGAGYSSLLVLADDMESPASSDALYARPGDLRRALKMEGGALPDDEALDLLRSACDLIDDRLGPRPVDPETGRKVVTAEEEPWRVEKLREATVEVARVLFSDPGVERRQRWRSVSGDVATGSPFGAAYGERAEVLISASGLAFKFARARGRRRSRNSQIVRSFEERGRD